MSSTLVIYHGLPGSGKSTLAHAEYGDREDAVIVERDNIREELFGVEYHTLPKRERVPNAEEQVTEVWNKRLNDALSEGRIAVCSDTNLNWRSVTDLYRIGKKHGADIRHNYVETPIDECKRRNANRERVVPEFVIDKMAKNGLDRNGRIKRWVWSDARQMVYGVQPENPVLADLNNRLAIVNPFHKGSGVVVLDCDGTLADNHEDAQRYLNNVEPGKRKNFVAFFESIEKARVNRDVLTLANNLRGEGLNIVLVTGRSGEYGRELARFVERSGVKVSKVLAKREGDMRSSNEFKTDAIRDIENAGYEIVHAIDDRQQDIDMFNSRGILVSTVDVSGNVATLYGSGKCIRCGRPLQNGSIGEACKRKA